MDKIRRTIKVLTNYEQLALLRQPNPRAPTGLRNLCLISLMLKTGLRVSETINLKDTDIDWNNGKIHIAGSGGASERTLWLDDQEVQLLGRWRKIRPKISDLFFSTLSGKKMQDRYIREMVKRLARKAGINKDVYPHLLRYTFAADLMRETRDLQVLRDALGHKDLSATNAYAKLLLKDHDLPVYSIVSKKRSGIKVPGEEQQSFSVIEDVNKLQRPTSGAPGKPEKKTRKIKDSDTLKTTVLQGNQQPEESIAKLTITVEADSDDQSRIAIPAIKCSCCDYILHYQGNCPKCGTSFSAILRHWGKNI